MSSKDIPADIVLSIEYLDYAVEAKPRPGTDRMPSGLRALHSVSRLLADMPSIVNPAVGRAAAVRSCEELAVCIVGLRNEVSLWLLFGGRYRCRAGFCFEGRSPCSFSPHGTIALFW